MGLDDAVDPASGRAVADVGLFGVARVDRGEDLFVRRRVDGLAAAIRDESRFVLVRADVMVTVEGNDRFLQLTDGVGSYSPATNETLQKANISFQEMIQVRNKLVTAYQDVMNIQV